MKLRSGVDPGGSRDIRGIELRALIFNAARDNKLNRLKIFLSGMQRACLEDCLNIRDGSAENVPTVIAARNGHLDCLKYLIQMGADPSLCGTVSFDGETIQGAPPLWAAAAAGHFEVVLYLIIRVRVDINQPTQTFSTPLRGACYDGHLEIVEFLVERGADMEIANRHGHTPLMIACFRKKPDVVKFLLQKGADPRKSSNKGNTALHDAAEADSLELVVMLMRYGAVLQDDEHGVCPLLGAAMLANDKVFNKLMYHCGDPFRRRDAWKMYGSSLIDKKMNMDGAIVAWKKALREVVPPHIEDNLPSIYEGYKEACTEEEVDRIASDPDAVRMQALIVRERILGGGHSDVHYYLRMRGAVYCDMGEMERCFALWMYALHLQQKFLAPLHSSTIGTLQAFQDTFSIALNDILIDGPVRGANAADWPALTVTFTNLNEVFEKVCYEMERTQRLAHIEWQTGQKRNENGLDLARFIRACNRIHVFPLHLSCMEDDKSISRGVEDFRIPSVYCVEKLLEAGADPNRRDEDGNMPLHAVLCNERPRPSFVKALLEGGALLFARDPHDQTAWTLIKERLPSVSADLRLGRYLTLFGLAAHAVRLNSLPYRECVPLDIQPIVDIY